MQKPGFDLVTVAVAEGLEAAPWDPYAGFPFMVPIQTVENVGHSGSARKARGDKMKARALKRPITHGQPART